MIKLPDTWANTCFDSNEVAKRLTMRSLNEILNECLSYNKFWKRMTDKNKKG